MQVVVLAAGLGTRLRPLTYKIPKVMVPVGGKPFFEYVLGLLRSNGLTRIVLCVGYLGTQIEQHFKDGSDFGIDITYSVEREMQLLGTGGALKNAAHLLEEEFMVLYGDTFLDIDYQDLISYFHRHGRLGTMVAFANEERIVENNVEINSSNEILSYNKETELDANCVDAGVLVLKKDIIDLMPADKKFSLEKRIYPHLIEQKQFLAYPTSQRFYDIGTFDRLKRFNKYLPSLKCTCVTDATEKNRKDYVKGRYQK